MLELSTTLRELGDSSAQWDKAADVLASTDVIDRQEVKDLVPFNHLRNSRADSGFSYWVNSGFEVDAENGVSGTASFKAEGESGMTKSLMQTVYPANRSSYTFSAQIASENLEKALPVRSVSRWSLNMRTVPQKRGLLICIKEALWLILHRQPMISHQKAPSESSPLQFVSA